LSQLAEGKNLGILVYCLSSISGGAVSYLRNMAPLLDKEFEKSSDGHNLIFLAHEDQRSLLESINDFRIVWIEGRRPTGYRRILWEQMNISRLVRQEAIDVLFTPYQIGPRAQGVKHVMMIRNMEPFRFTKYRYSIVTWLRNQLLRRESSRLLRAADRVIAVSEFVRDELIQGIGVEKNRIRMIYHGRNETLAPGGDAQKDSLLLRKLGIVNDYILTCGSLLPYRRCEDVVAAFNQCADNLHAGVQLVIAGAVTDRRYGKFIRRAIAASPYRDRILALGHVPWETMAALYRSCLLCVLATEIEACPNIAIESMAAGCVIISSDRPPLPEMFGGASLEYHARDIDHLVEQMRRGIDQEELRREMKTRALKRADAFSWEKCARETYAALTDWQDKEH